MRHKRILDVAAANPDASLEAIAEEVPTATVDLVERVLERYGDPAESTTAEAPVANGGGDPDGDENDRDEPSARGIADTGEHPTDATAPDATSPPSDGETPENPAAADLPDLDALSAKQRETLATIARNPTVTQREIADELGVSAATVSNRVNEIEGFSWDERAAIVSRLFEPSDSCDPEAATMTHQSTDDTMHAVIERL